MDIASLVLTSSSGETPVDRRAVTSLPPGVLEQRFGKEGVDELDALVEEAEVTSSVARVV